MNQNKIPAGHRGNLTTILTAGKNGDLGLLQAKHKSSGEFHTLLVAFGRKDGEVLITPLARLLEENPFELYESPA